MLRRRFLGALAASAWLRSAPAGVAATPSRDGAGRPLVAVRLDGRGPFRFLLDTAASTSAISAFLARELRLPASDDAAPYAIAGSTGGGSATRVQARELVADAARVLRPSLAVLPESGGRDPGVDGVLGADLLLGARARVVVSFADGQVMIVAGDAGRGPDAGSRDAAPRSGRPRDSSPRLLPLRLARELGPLIAVRAAFDRPARRGADAIAAILDTGAQRSVANAAVATLLGLRDAPSTEFVLRGAAGQALAAREHDAPALRLGTLALPAQPLLFADLPVFEAWGWRDQPAMLLGMDLLGRLSRLAVDYGRSPITVSIAGAATGANAPDR